MSNFSDVFGSYANQAETLEAAREIIIHGENTPYTGLYKNYTIGYGYDIRKQTGNQVIQDFTNAGISLNPALYNALSSVGNVAVGTNSTVNNHFTTQFGAAGLSQGFATSLLDTILPRYRTMIVNKVTPLGITLNNDGLQAYLISQTYNGGSGMFGQNQTDAVRNDDPALFLVDVLFGNNKAEGKYEQGLQNRRLKDLAATLGVPFNDQMVNGKYIVTGLNLSSNLFAAETIREGFDVYKDKVNSLIKSAGSGSKALLELKSSLLLEAEIKLTPGASSNVTIYRDALLAFINSIQNDESFQNQNGIQIAYNGPLGDLYLSNDFNDFFNDDGTLTSLHSELLIDLRNSSGVPVAQVVSGNTPIVTASGEITTVGKFISAINNRVISVGNFLERTASTLVNSFDDAISGPQAAITLATIAARLVQGENIETIIEELALQITSSTIANNVLDEILHDEIAGFLAAKYDSVINPVGSVTQDTNGDWLIKSRDGSLIERVDPDEARSLANYDLAYKAITMFVVNGILSGDYQQAAQNTSIQLIVNEGFAKISAFQTYQLKDGKVVLDASGNPTVSGINTAGMAAAAAAIALITSFVSEGEITEQAVGQAVLAGTTVLITSAILATYVAATSSGAFAVAFAEAFGKAGAGLGPWGVAAGIIIGAIVGYTLGELFGGSKTYHDETVSHTIEVQPDGSFKVIGLRAAGSLLRTSGTTDDDYIGNDSVNDTAGHDVIVGQAGKNEIYAKGGHDFIEGRANDDYIEAGTGDDHVEAGSGNDFVDGGAGDDRIYGQAGNDKILGGAGNDLILGGAGDDLIEGNDGNDQIYGGTGADTVTGGAGNDIIDGGSGNDILSGEAGDDEISGGSGDDILHGNDGNDILMGGTGNDDLRGDNGDDILFGEEGVDQLYGGDGNDSLDGGNENDILFGGLGNDTLHGSYGDDDLYGEIGNDLLAGGAGNDLLDGGDGNDIYLYSRFDGQDTIQDSDGTNSLKLMDLNVINMAAIARVGDNLVITFDSFNSITVKDQFTTSGISTIEFANGQAITVANMAFDNVTGAGSYTLTNGSNILSGYALQLTNYQLLTMPFQVSTHLSTGWLTNNYDTSVQTDAYQVELYNDVQVRMWSKKAGFMGMKSSMGFYDYFEQFLHGSGTSDRIVGMYWNETINGDSNNDQLYGNMGDDIINGGTDHDIMFGGGGIDTMNGNAGNDKLFGGTGNDIMSGGDGNDTLYGEQGNDTLNGDAGDDMLSGGDGNDIINGGAGKDLLYGDAGNDILNGGDDDDFLSGGDGDDTLNGGNGNDLLHGGSGTNIMNGGAGDDIFLSGNGHNTIDGGDGLDTIYLSGRGIDYSVLIAADGTVNITDLRPGTPDGTISAVNVERLQFNDQLIDLATAFPRINTLTIPVGSVFTGALDLPAGFTIELVQGPVLGSVVFNPNGTYTYTAPSVAGNTTYRYKITNQLGFSEIFDAAVNVPYAANNEFAFGGNVVLAPMVMSGTEVDAGYRHQSKIISLKDGGHITTWSTQDADGSLQNVYFQRFDKSGNAVGGKVRANTTVTGAQVLVDGIGLADGGYVLTWYDQSQSSPMMRRYNASGVAVTPEIRITPGTGANWVGIYVEAVQNNDGSIGVIWKGQMGSADYNIYYQQYDQNNNSIGTPVLVNTSTGGEQGMVKIAKLSDGNLIAVWEDWNAGDSAGHALFGQILNATGNKIGSQFVVNTTAAGNQNRVDLAALDNGGFVSVWQSDSAQDGSGLGIYGQQFDNMGNKIGTEFRVNTATSGDQSSPSITKLSDGGFYVTWQSNGQDGSSWGVFGQRFNSSGNKVGGETLIDKNTYNSQEQISVAELADGTIIATWRSNQSGSYRVIQKNLGKTSTLSSEENLVSIGVGNSNFDQDGIRERPQSTKLMGGGYVMTWTASDVVGGQNVYYQVVNDNGVAVTAPTIASVVTSDYQFKIIPVALADGGFALTWMWLVSGGGNQYGSTTWRRYNASGVVQTGEVQTQPVPNGVTVGWDNTGGTIVQMQDGSIVAAWSGNQSQGHRDVYMMRFNENGTILNTQVKVNTTTAGDQQLVSAVELSNGNIAIVWRDDGGADGSGQGIYYRIMTGTGTSVTTELRANTTTSGNQSAPSITSLAAGGYVVTWQSSGQDGSGWGIYAQRFDNAGGKVGAETRINTSITGDQIQPYVTSLADGGYFIVWNSPDGSGSGIFGQRYDSTGKAVGGEVFINDAIINTEDFPSVSQIVNGDLLFMWRQNLNGWQIIRKQVPLNDLKYFEQTIAPTYVYNSTYDQDHIRERPEVSKLYGGGYVITWMIGGGATAQDAYYQVFNANGVAVTQPAFVSTVQVGSQFKSSITALADGSFIMSWIHINGPQSVIWRHFSASGIPLTGEILTQPLNSGYYTTGGNAVQLQDGSIAVIWSGQQPSTNNHDIYMSRYAIDGTLLSSQIKINTTTAAVVPISTLLSDGNILAVWRNDVGDGSGQGVSFRILSPSGQPITGELRANTTISGSQNQPHVAALADGFVVTWQSSGQDTSGWGVYAQIFDNNGNKVGIEQRINTTISGDQYLPEVTSLQDGGYFIVWISNGQDGSATGVYGQQFDKNGSMVGSEIQINQSYINSQEYPSVTQLTGGDLLITWRSNANGAYQVMQRRISSPAHYTVNGTSVDDTLVGTSSNDVISGAAGNDILVGNGGNDILDGGEGRDTARFSGNLADYTISIVGSDITVSDNRIGSNDGTDTLKRIEVLSFNDLDYDWASHFYDYPLVQLVQGKTFNGQLQLKAGDVVTIVEGPTNGIASINSNGVFSYTAPADYIGGAKLVYKVTNSQGISRISHVQFGVVISDFLNGGSESQVNNHTPNNQYGAAVAKISDGKTVITWTSYDQDGSYGGVYAAVYDTNGTKVVQDFRVNTTTNMQQFRPQVAALTDGGYVIVWESWAQGGPNYNVYYQRYDSTGNKIGNETAVKTNYTTPEGRSFVAAAGLSDGGFVFAYASSDQDGSYESVNVKQYDSNGAVVSEGQANTFTVGTQFKPNIAVLQNGSYVVIWSSWTQGGSQYSVWGQRYSLAGTKMGGEFNIAQSNTPEVDTYTDIVALTNGDFVVTWTESATDGSSYGVFAKRYNSAGNVVKDKFQVNSYTLNNQWQPHLASMADGGYLVVWESWAQAGATAYAIFAQRYDLNNNKVGGEFQVKYDTQHNANVEYAMNVSEQANGNISIVWTSPDGNGTGIFTKQVTIQAASFNGTSGDDIFVGNSGNQLIEGLSGTDTVVLSGNMADYQVTTTVGGLVVRDLRTNSPDGTDTLKSIERLQFADTTIDLTNAFPSIGIFQVPVGGSFSYTLPSNVTATILAQPQYGTLTVSPDGHTLSYTGSLNDIGNLNFTYALTNTDSGFTVSNTGNIKLFNEATKGYVPLSEQSFGSYAGPLITSGFLQTAIRRLPNGKIVVVHSTQNGKMRLNIFDSTTMTQIGSEVLVAPSINADQGSAKIEVMSDGGFIITWNGFNGGGNYQWSEAYLQRYDSNGIQIGSWQQVNMDSNGAVYQVDSTTLVDGKVVVVYDQAHINMWGLRTNEAWSSNIKFKVYNADGTVAVSETTLTALDGSKNRYPAVTGLLDGRFMIIYSSDDQNGNATAIYGQILNANGTKSGNAFIVNSSNPSMSWNANTLATLKDGTILTAWEAGDGGGFGIYAQLINPNGTLKGSTFLVNPTAAGSQVTPSLVALADGGFFITWASQNPASPNDWDVWGKRFDASGNSVDMAFVGSNSLDLGSAIRLNTVTAGHQFSPVVTEMPDGDLVIAWLNMPTSGASKVILSRYNATIHGSQTLYGDYGDNIITGNQSDSTIYGLAGNDVLDGGAGNDLLNGGPGDDIYKFGKGYDSDTIDNQDSAGNDAVVFNSNVDIHELWFKQNGYNLEVSILGTLDKLTLQNWYVNDGQKVDTFKTSTGDILSKNKVDQLVSAMAGFNPQAIGSVSSLSDLPQSVQNTIAASWTS